MKRASFRKTAENQQRLEGARCALGRKATHTAAWAIERIIVVSRGAVGLCVWVILAASVAAAADVSRRSDASAPAASPAAVAATEFSAGPKADERSLAGRWRFALDRDDTGESDRWFARPLPETIQLPGALTAQGFGDAPSFQTQWTGTGWRYPKMYQEYQSPENFKFPFFLQPSRHYVGAAWYQREIEFPAEWKGKRVELFIERPHWHTSVWLDDRLIGNQNSLGVPHVFELTASAEPGRHVLTIRIDNRLHINVGPLSHSVTDHTQGNWNGIVGTIALRATAPAHIASVRVFSRVDDRSVLVRVEARGADRGRVRLTVEDEEAKAVAAEGVVTLDKGRGEARLSLGPRAELWNEFRPKLYRLTACLEATAEGAASPAEAAQPTASKAGHLRTVRFGLREVGTAGGRITLNGRPIFLRGTLECCIFPLTGHPPTDVESWRRIIRICKAHGLNHIRFHSWCPPEAAFHAADELGFYYHVECSSWANSGAEIGSGGPLDDWLEAETGRIIEAYGNHPSFVMLCYGNEPAGKNHVRWLKEWVARWRQRDPQRLYTTGAGWPVVEGSDYHSSPQPRIQAWGGGLKSLLNARPPATDFDWSEVIARMPPGPVVSHEIGQWCVYPNFAEIDKYTGYFRAKNFEIFREEARRNGVLGWAKEYLHASGRLQVLAYKHDIEAALRTPEFGGFQLLDLHDFPGQGTALVGVLDAFWDEKGYCTAAEYARFCGPVVPLARIKRMVLTDCEKLEARFLLAQFGPEDLREVAPRWTLTLPEGTIVAEGRLPPRAWAAGKLHELGECSIALDRVKAPAKLKLELSVGPAVNAWDIFVFPAAKADEPPAAELTIVSEVDAKTLEGLESGGRVVWFVPPRLVRPDPQRGPIVTGFSPIFWNTAWTNGQPPHTLGIYCDPKHPALARFPTENHSNWQWWEIVSRAAPMIVTQHRDLEPIVHVIDDWFTARKLALVFEANVGRGKILVCSADLESDLDARPAARQLRRSLLDYAAGERFAPKATVTAADLAAIVRPANAADRMGAQVLRASSHAPDYPPEHALDGNPQTFWHTPWGEGAPAFPHELVIELARPGALQGLNVLARQDGNRNGMIRRCEVYVSDDANDWGVPAAKAELRRTDSAQPINFDRPRKGRFVRIVARDGFDRQPFASLAEVELIPAE